MARSSTTRKAIEPEAPARLEEVIQRLRRWKPSSRSEIAIALEQSSEDLRLEVMNDDSRSIGLRLGFLRRRVVALCEELARLDPDGLAEFLPKFEKRLWDIRMEQAGEDEARLERLLMVLGGRTKRVYMKLKRSDPNQLGLVLEE